MSENNSYTPITPTSEDVVASIRRKTALTLPDDPSAAGLRAETIRRRFWEAICGADASVLAELTRIIEEANLALGTVDERLKGHDNTLAGLPDELDKKVEDATRILNVPPTSEARTLSNGVDPSVDVSIRENEGGPRLHFNFGIPKGEKGDSVELQADAVRRRFTFTVNEDDEAAYLVSSDGVWNESGGYRYHNMTAHSVWRYPIENAEAVTGALWHGHTAQQTLLEASVNGEDWVTLIDNGGAQIGHQGYIDICDHLDIAGSGTSHLYVRIGDSNTEDGSGGALLNDMPVMLEITYGRINPYALPPVTDAYDGAHLVVIDGKWRAVGGESAVSRVFTVSFRVAEDSERKYIDEYSNGTDFDKTLDGTCRFMDGTRYIIYKYHLPNSGQIRRLYFTATFKQKVLLEVSTDKEKWVELLRCEPGEDGKGMAKMRMTFDLTDKVNLLRWDDIYIRLSNSDAPNGFGGAVMRNESVDLRIERFEINQPVLLFGYEEELDALLNHARSLISGGEAK